MPNPKNTPRSAQVIAAIQQKGGPGKSTVIRCLAGLMIKDGAKVAIIDTDPQQTCIKWSEKLDMGIDALVWEDDEQIARLIKKLRPDYDAIFIDTAGYKSVMGVQVAAKADLILIPTKASTEDAGGAIRTWDFIDSMYEDKIDNNQVFIVYNDIDKTANITQSIKDAILAKGCKMIDTPIYHRTGFKEMGVTGGLPTGSALAAIKSFMGNLQTSQLITFYKDLANA